MSTPHDSALFYPRGDHGAAGARGSARGFSLVELLIAAALLLAVMAGVAALVEPVSGAAERDPQAIDLEQRLRAAVEALARDLTRAGGGTGYGRRTGPIGYYFAPVLPYGIGAAARGGPDAAEPSAITVMYAPHGGPSATLSTDFSGGVALIEPGPGCAAADPSCGFETGMRVVMFGDTGRYDVYTVTAVTGPALTLEERDGAAPQPMPRGSSLAGIVSRTYYLDAADRRLYVYDGYRSTSPLADHVVVLRFEYLGDPEPPRIVRPLTDPTGPWTTYAARPGEAAVDEDPADEWGAGENCVFARVGGNPVPRLPQLEASSPEQLVPLPPAMLADGPWCPAGTGSVRYDADLLRIRVIRVTLRLEVESARLRAANPAGQTLFVNPGQARSAEGFVPDREIHFDVAPANLGLGP